jgi:AMIN domain-containing protein
MALWFASHRLDQTVSIRSVRVELPNQSGITVIVIEGSGALPEPASGRASDPPRIYLDFPGVLPLRVVEPVSPNPLLTRIRVAQHSASPLVTRLVLDLIQEATYRIDVSARTEGRVVVLVRAQSAGSAPSRASGVSAEMQYTLRVSATLVRLEALRPLLEAIDRRTAKLPGDLDAALQEFDDAAKLLTAVKPPSSRMSTHALLLRTCTLGARAVRMRQTAMGQDAASGWEAASAAAGALLMLERANGDLTKGKR